MRRRPLTIEAQCAAMKSVWPNFVTKDVSRADQRARWVGVVKPQFSPFTVEVRYAVGLFPQTRILKPELVRLPDNPEGQLPHVYPPAGDPRLCLFDPEAGEWDSAMALAHTIVPWAMDWIVCYELWLMTGRWTGGGRHAGDVVAEEATT